MKPEVEIYDTTLRDGSQGEGINFSVVDKLRIAEKLDAFGVHYIEGGWPGSNPKDIEFFARPSGRKFKHARLAAFSSTRRKGVAVESDDQVRLLLEAETPVVTIFGKTWLLHVKEVLRATPDENLAMIGDTVRYLKDHGRIGHLRRRARLRRLQGRSGVRAGHLAGGGEGRRGRAWCCATPTAAACPREIAADHRRGAREADGAARHPHPQRHRARAWPMRWRQSKPARRRSRARSTATASAPATATSPASSPTLAFKMKKTLRAGGIAGAS